MAIMNNMHILPLWHRGIWLSVAFWVIIALSTNWEPGPSPEWKPNEGRKIGIAGPRLEPIGASEIPTRRYLYSYVAEGFRAIKLCTNLEWSFYTNLIALKACGYINTSSNGQLAVLYYLDGSENIKKELEKRANAFSLHIEFHSIGRARLFQLLRSSNQSFLFIDYDMWSDYLNVNMLQLPPCVPDSTKNPCRQELDTGISMRVADVLTLEIYVPLLLRTIQTFNPTPDSLRNILELETSKYNISSAIDAACHWAVTNSTELSIWKTKYNDLKKQYDIMVFTCDDHIKNNNLLQYLKKGINKQYEILNAYIEIWYFSQTCSDVNFVKNSLHRRLERNPRQRLLGAVVDRKYITEIANNVDGIELPVILADAPGVNPSSNSSLWISSGRSYHLVLALERFMNIMKWGRIAILSEKTGTAEDFVRALKTRNEQNKKSNKKGFAFRDHTPDGFSKAEVNEYLKVLKNIDDAHVILINTNYEYARTILTAAKALTMNGTDYVWIVREWRTNEMDVRPITFSFWSRKHNKALTSTGNHDFPSKWPVKAEALSDAVLTLVQGFKKVFLDFPETQHDVHSKLALMKFREYVHNTPIIGITRNLTYKDHSIEETFVYVEEWHYNKSYLLAIWRVNSTTVVIEQENLNGKYMNVRDGSTTCLVITGDEYLPTCHTPKVAVAVILLVLSLCVALFKYRAIKRSQLMKEQIKQSLLLQRQEYIAIINHLKIERSDLNLYEELGAGHFGQVRRAVLKFQKQKGQQLAVKSLRDNGDEIEMMREASILASLDHNNIIRLIGVCIDDKPMLLIMEHAFFGDLLHYLHDRWYLAEGADTLCETNLEDNREESIHVSARALTRLAHQAASALAYLNQQGFVHRDVRAANCLVDAKRSLKLADFGLARRITAANPEAGAEYTSTRTRVLPVSWMAPESLIHGIFSTASDIWSLGLLIYEIVTLGAHPYGRLPAGNVFQFVVSGGQPSMPTDASPQTVSLAQLCWKRNPEERPSAADVVVYLAERPCSLSPAFKCTYDSFDNTESSSNESFTTRLIP